MRRVIFSESVRDAIVRYSQNYRTYYTNLYRDTGLGPVEEIIISSYIAESDSRHNEIVHLLITKLSDDIVLGRLSDTSVVLRWRSRYLFVSWEDDGDDRIITELDIR